MKDQLKNKTEKEDLKWVRKAKKGNQKAFEKLVIKYQKLIYYSVRKIVLDHDNSNDIVQDTFVKAYSNLYRFGEQLPFYPWLHRIAINTTLNFQTRISRAKETYTNSEDNEIKQVALNNKNPLEEVIENEFQKKVTEALHRLTFDQRMVFILRTSEELSYQEISEQLDISIGTVMSRLSRARAKLKQLLQQYLSNNEIKV
ncbi:MAG: sigma-70 family RNA polymerase sigma factor [bacterium]|nr:MAG: sigma-70 family RNA polymerase sigma factor [bacterium]